MQTYSHILLTVWLRSRLAKRRLSPHWAILLGSFAPDLPLCFLTLRYFFQQYSLHGSDFSLFGPDYDFYYFQDPLWLVSCNLFHAPAAVLVWIAIGYFAGIRRGSPFWTAFFWFAAGCALHAAIDIATHHDDGPLLGFPFDWETRFHSPISYWDRRHHAAIVAPIEHAIDALILAWALIRMWKRRNESRGFRVL